MLLRLTISFNKLKSKIFLFNYNNQILNIKNHELFYNKFKNCYNKNYKKTIKITLYATTSIYIILFCFVHISNAIILTQLLH